MTALRTRLAFAVAALLVAGFVIAFSARPAIVLSTAAIDDGLFMSLGMQLASGRWLGPYNELTLVKGPGFPAFLALSNVLGTPFPLALGLTLAGCASFAALIAARLFRSAWAGLALLAALLLTPILYDGAMLGVFRDPFYTALTVALVSAAIALATGRVARPTPLALLVGVLAAWFWLTREEGLWLLPCLALLLLIPLLNIERTDALALRRRLAPAGVAIGVALALTVGFGLVNWAVYGRFVVNEIKDSPFQSALSALQDAAAPFHKEGVPVPAAARARIYAVSPAFASVREPILDGPGLAEASQYGCRENPAMCGDLGGGWFFWFLRSSAAQQGQYATPGKAAAFYRQMAREVRAACDDGRLSCQHWGVPLVPPMRAAEFPHVAASLGRVANVMTLGPPMTLAQRPSDLTGPNAAAMVSFLNLPGGDPGTRRLVGWFRGQGAQWFGVQAAPSVRVLSFERIPSPDVATYFKDPALALQRFSLDVACPPGPCLVTLAPDGGPAQTVDLAAIDRGEHRLGAATLFLDNTGGDGSDALLKTRFSSAWLSGVVKLQPLYRGLFALGAAAYLALLVQAALRRRLTSVLVICTALLSAIAARAVILALIDALSFRAATYPYALPAIALAVMFSIYALLGAAAALAERRRPILDSEPVAGA